MDGTHPSPPEPTTTAAASAPPRPSDRLHLARSSGLMQAVGLVVGLFMFGVVFLVGLGVGAFFVAAGALFEEDVMQEIYREGGSQRVAVIPVTGIIDGFQAEVARMLVDEALADDRVKACVLRVDSPGGAIAPSDEIWYQVKRMRDEGLPVVASFGGLAASGGYYVSCATDHIVAEPTTVTGSIGVIAQTFILKDLLDKVGVEPVTLLATDSPAKDLGNPFRHWTEEDRRKYLAMLDAAYEIFNQRVREGRQHVITDAARVDELADGSIYTADEALQSGLVDSVGYLDDAIVQAERLAGLVRGRSTVVVLHIPDPIFGGFAAARGPSLPAGLDAERARTFVTELGVPRVMYLMR